MTGWGLAAVFFAVAGGGAFVAYWSGIGAAEAKAARRNRALRAEVARLRQVLVERSIAEQRVMANADGPRLTAAEVDAWHRLVCDLEDEAA